MKFAASKNHANLDQFDLPRRLRRLSNLAYNLWWTWNGEAARLFRLLDLDLWEQVDHNPVRFLRSVSTERLTTAIHDRYFLDMYDRVIQEFDEYMDSGVESWFTRTYPDRVNSPIAYFSTEFGLHETLPFYAGGLGVLSGDHLKESSDLGLPLIAIGFLYTEGYFKQRITEDGWQEALYTSLAFSDLPVHAVLDDDDEPVMIDVDLAGRKVFARLWRVQVGRVPLFLLDSNVDINQPADRNLTARLYTSDLDLRISQEIVLGIGGVRALRKLGYNPVIWHMNEGHSAFITLERLREQVAAGHSFEEAREEIRATTAFTTHTPVAAGHDEFPLWLIDKYFSNFWPELDLDRESFIDLAQHKHPWGEVFSMAILAIRMSSRLNGVSELHGRVARQMWSFLWHEKSEDEVPITHITNGIHTGTWLARRLKNLYDRYLEPDWLERIDHPEAWQGIERIPDAELWRVRRQLKRKLVAYMRERARIPWSQDKIRPVQVIGSGVLLDPYALTIGFARRFATYKRAHLLLTDPERLLEVINNPGQPVQVIFAGKAHPADEPGKRLIQEVYNAVKGASFAGRLVFLEDYDINLARYLVQGVDVWLNNPRRPKEASGTSGQKAALNGVLNLSILDGWWREGYNGRNGWAIGEDRDWEDVEGSDEADAESLYRMLEEEVVPLYYERSADNLPYEWLGWMKESIISLAPQFSMRRMVKEYVREIYYQSTPEPSKV
ncbi:MAG: alpha-glucan family phosphorylase [Anaerolineales bacterium]|nr:alpha-glucan family phosphorylase [Anaerolineales bacterium]